MEVDERISLEEFPPSVSPASAPSPSNECPSTMTEEAELDNELLNEDSPDEINEPLEERDSRNLGNESPSIVLPQELDASDSDGGNPPGESSPKPHARARIIAVTPQPGSSTPDIRSDHDSGVKIDNDDDNDDDSGTPEKRNATPSLASSEGSLRSVSADLEPVQPAAKKGGSSQPPRFKNDVEPDNYHPRAPPVRYNRAVHSLQCKAMLIIMFASIVAVILVVGFIILNAGSDDEPITRPAKLDGSFNITNRLYRSTYAYINSTDYIQLGDEFVSTMNATFQSSRLYDDFYENTTIDLIGRSISPVSGTPRPILEFTINLVIPGEGPIGQGGMTTEAPSTRAPDVTGSTPVPGPTSGHVPPVIGDIIGYLVNVTDNDNFGNFTGQMTLTPSLL